MGPAAIPIVIGLTAVSAGVGAYGSIKKGQAEASAYKANARYLSDKAKFDTDASEAEAFQIAQENTRNMGKVRSAYAAGGVDLTTGTPLDVMADTATQGELARRLKLYQGQIAAKSDLAQAGIYDTQAGAAKSAGTIGAGSTLLSGGAQIAKVLV